MQYNLQTFSKLSLNVVETLLQHYIVSWEDTKLTCREEITLNINICKMTIMITNQAIG